MIAANHTAWAEWIFQPYLMRLFKQHFNAIHLLGRTPKTDPNLPLLLLPNHSTWWDGFFVYLLNKEIFRRPAYLMMLEEQLLRYRFFSRLGAFSINPTSASSVWESMKYAAGILRQHASPKPLMCIFPQGELLPWSRKPLGYKRGIEVLMSSIQEKINILPLAIKVEFLNEQKAEAFFLFGENKTTTEQRFPVLQTLQREEEELLRELAAQIDCGKKGSLLLGRNLSTR